MQLFPSNIKYSTEIILYISDKTILNTISYIVSYIHVIDKFCAINVHWLTESITINFVLGYYMENKLHIFHLLLTVNTSSANRNFPIDRTM